MILFLDTSSGICKIRLKKNGAELDFSHQFDREMGKNVIFFIKDCLTKSGFDWHDISGLAVFSGPGSFTGLRIGATVMNTLADGLNLPIIGQKNLGKTDETWTEIAEKRLLFGENDKIVVPFYGAEANITKPRK